MSAHLRPADDLKAVIAILVRLTSDAGSLFGVAAAAIRREDFRTAAAHECRALANALMIELKALTRATEDKIDDRRPLHLDPRSLLDAELADVFDRLGEAGNAQLLRARASERQEAGKDLLRIWRADDAAAFGGASAGVLSLASTLWRCRVRAATNLSRPASIALPVIAGAASAFFDRDRRLGDDGLESRVITTLEGKVVGKIRGIVGGAPQLPLQVLIDDKLAASSSTTGQRLFRWMIHSAHGQAGTGQRDPRAIVVPTGFSGLARLLGLRGKDEGSLLREALDLFQHTTILFDAKEYHGLLTWELTHRTAPGRTSNLKIILGDALMPQYEQRGAKGTPERWLVPIPGAPPPLIGRRNDHGPQMFLQLLVMIELRRCADELFVEGSVRIDNAQWRELADRARLPSRCLQNVLEGWTAPGANPYPFLQIVGTDRYSLAPKFAKELAILRAGGEMTVNARRRGKRSAALRRRKVNTPASNG